MFCEIFKMLFRSHPTCDLFLTLQIYTAIFTPVCTRFYFRDDISSCRGYAGFAQNMKLLCTGTVSQDFRPFLCFKFPVLIFPAMPTAFYALSSCSLYSYISEQGRRERFCIFASPTRKHFDDAKREDAPPLKTTRSRKTQRVTDAKFCVTGISDIR